MSDLDTRLDGLSATRTRSDADVADVWARGRAQRHRRRLVAGSAMIVVLLVVALAGALTSGDDGDVDTITGPGPSTPDPADDRTPVTTGSLGFSTLATTFAVDSFPFVRFVGDLAAYDEVEAEMTSRFGMAIPRAGLEGTFDPAERALVVFAIPSNDCPPVFAGLEEIDPGILAPRFVDPSYRTCEEVPVSYIIVAAVDRSTFDGISRIRLPAQEPFFSASPESEVVPFEIVPGLPDEVISTEFGDESGSAPLPPVGEASLAFDRDNVPVVIIHHADGTVSAIDARTADPSDTIIGLVRWDAARRAFFGPSGVFDEYGRRLDRPQSGDLVTHATRVDGDTVHFGDIVRTPLGDPIVETTDAPATTDIDVGALTLQSLDQALDAPVGTVVLVDATMVADATGARVCKLDGEEVRRTFIVECPLDAPEAFGIELLGEDITFLGNPILATRAEGGFADIVTVFPAK